MNDDFGEFHELAMSLGGDLGFPPGTVDVAAMMIEANDIFHGRAFMDMEETPNPHGWVNGKCPNPEHDDKNPSFGVNLRTGACHCMVCGTWKFGEVLLMLDEFHNPEARAFPDHESVRVFIRRFMDEEAVDPLARLRGGGSALREFQYTPDLDRAEMVMAAWAQRNHSLDFDRTEEHLQEFDRLCLADEDRAVIYSKKLVMGII